MRGVRDSWLAVVAVVLLALAGCGSGNDGTSKAGAGDQRQRALDAVKRYQTATIERDPRAYCDQLTGHAKRLLVTRLAPLGGAADCEASAKRVLSLAGKDDLAGIKRSRDALGPEKVKLNGRRALVGVRPGSRLRLVLTDAGWLIADPSLH